MSGMRRLGGEMRGGERKGGVVKWERIGDLCEGEGNSIVWTCVRTSSTVRRGTDIHGDRDFIFSCLSYNQCHSPIIFIHSVACWVKLNLHHCGGRKSDMMPKVLYNVKCESPESCSNCHDC